MITPINPLTAGRFTDRKIDVNNDCMVIDWAVITIYTKGERKNWACS